MNMCFTRYFIASLFALFPYCSYAHSQIDYVVLDSKGIIGLPKGSMLSREQIISLPANGWLRLIGRDAKPVLLTGPVSGTAGHLIVIAETERLEGTLLERLAAILSQPFRVRGGSDAEADFDAIDLLMPGRQCAIGSFPKIRRPDGFGTAMVELARSSTRQRVKFHWPASQTTLPWPNAIDLVANGEYETEVTAMTIDGAMRTLTAQFSLVLLPDAAFDNAAQALHILLQAECNAQVVRLIHSLSQPELAR